MGAGSRSAGFIYSPTGAPSKLTAMRSTWLVLATCAACSFDGGGAPPDGGPPPGELEKVLDSTDDFKAGSPVEASTYTSAAGTVEPTAWLPGLLLAEIDDVAGPYGTWAMKPARTAMVNVGLMAPPFDSVPKPPGAPNGGFVLWFSGEIRLNAGPQKLAFSVAGNAAAFADILGPSGSVLATCTDVSECAIDAPVPGWYRLHMAWSRSATATNNGLELQWAAGTGVPSAIALDRLRVAVHESELAGWRVEGYEFQRTFSHLLHGIALNYKQPFSLSWTPSLLGLDGATASPTYRNAGQLRILQEASYDFAISADGEAAYRLWIDGEWVTQAERFNPQPSGVKGETASRVLAAGWHDIVLEGYEQGGTSNDVRLTFGKTGQALKPPATADVRPLLGAGTAVTDGLTSNSVALVKDVFVSQIVNVAAVANAPEASAVDVSLRLQPRAWQGLEARIRSPGSGTTIPLTLDVTGLVVDQLGDVHASLTKAQLGTAPVSGIWTVEVKHPNAGGNLGGANVLSRARINVHYKGGPTVGSPEKQIALSSRYSRTLSLDKPRELRSLLATAIQPAGSKVEASLQICTDATATSCGADILPTELAVMKPTAQHLKLSVTFTSDGFAAPILDKLALRYKE
jgi:hypothetical protein